MSDPILEPERAKTRKARARKVVSGEEDPIVLSYELAELPSSQHRAGLAGLVMVIQWLDRQTGPRDGVCQITRLDASGLSLTVDRKGLQRIFDDIYAAEVVEQESRTPSRTRRRRYSGQW